MTVSTRIVVFTGGLAYSVRQGIIEIDRAIDGVQWLIVVETPRRTVGRLLRSQWRNLRRNGWRWIPYQVTDLWQRVAARFESLPSSTIGAEYAASALERRPNLRVLRVADINSESTCAAVLEFAPDLGLSLAASILRERLFGIPRLGTLNLHKGRLPDYRGMPPAFWELWNDEQAVGCSVHRVDAKLDTGAIVLHESIAREKYSTVRGMQLRLDTLGVKLMRAAVEQVLSGEAQSLPQPAGGRTNRKPTLAQIATLERRLAQQGARRSLSLRRMIVNMAGASARFLWRLGLGRLLAPRIVVLLYHRVGDDARDNLTVGIEQFDRQMALIRKYCRPVSIEEVLDDSVIPTRGRPLVCVTFDDGYHDNYANAAPILLRHQIPGAFFVSTGLIGTEGRFSHDVRRGNPLIPLMRWQDLREMCESGFVIGSHSVTHIDCASEPEEVVVSELERSRADLQRELGLQQVIFAYPYGGRQHMTSQRLELVKKAGYSGCLSGYGGTNIRPVARFNVLRRAVSWEYSDNALALEFLGLR